MFNFKPQSNIQRLRLENQKKLDKIDKALNQYDNKAIRPRFNALFGPVIPVKHNSLSKSDWLEIKRTLNHAAQLEKKAKRSSKSERAEYVQSIAQDLDKILNKLELS